MIRFSLAIGLICVPALAVAAATESVHRLSWYVHVDLIDEASGHDLAFYSGIVAEGMRSATDLLQGDQGPFDTPCCIGLDTLSLSTFGTSGDGLDVPSSAADFAQLDAISGPAGSSAFLVDSLAYCGGPTATAIGCANVAVCTGDPNDDPDLFLVLTLDAYDRGVFGEALAHERGHNSCLQHVSEDSCQMMRSGNGGGCVTGYECAQFVAGANATGDECVCHAGGGSTLADATPCSEDRVAGICSGGLCGELGSDASVGLIASGGTASSEADVPDERLRLSGASGGWSILGGFGSGAVPTGLAYAEERGVLFGVISDPGDDILIEIDPATGVTLAVVGPLVGLQVVTALAFDPGATDAADDDRLFALERVGSFEDLFQVDPDTGAATRVGGLQFGVQNGFSGLAWDSLHGRLYASGFTLGGLFEVGLNCSPQCPLSEVPVDVPRAFSSLAFSARTGRLYLVGSQSGPRTLYDAIDPDTLESIESIGIDGFTPGGLAALPASEPGRGLAGAISLVTLGAVGASRRVRRRSIRSRSRPARRPTARRR